MSATVITITLKDFPLEKERLAAIVLDAVGFRQRKGEGFVFAGDRTNALAACAALDGTIGTNLMQEPHDDEFDRF